MHREGHIGAGLIVYAPLAFLVVLVTSAELAFLGAVAVAGLSTVPDLDMRVPILPHRGPTHTIWFAVAIGVLTGIVGLLVGLQLSVVVGVGLFGFGVLLGTIAIISHIAADALTPMGVRPFEPWADEKYTWDLVTAANPIANYGLLGLGVLCAGLAAGAGVWIRSLV